IPSARDAIHRRLKATTLTEIERADALTTAIDIAMNRSPSDESIKHAEGLTSQIDALSNAVLRHRISAQSRMAADCSYADIDAKDLEHNLAQLKLIDQLPAGERNSYDYTRRHIYGNVALVTANRGQTDEAIRMLRQAKSELGGDEFDQAINRYSLV